MFHANLITPYKETELHGPNFTRPPPDLIEGEQEFKVEKILDAQPRGRGRKMHFLVKWKGYPTSDNSWEPRENLHMDRLIAEYNKKKQGQAEPKKKGVKSRRARMEEIIPFSPNNHLPSSHSKIMSARSAPIVSYAAIDATPIVSTSTSSTPVSPSSMSPSTPREATSSLSTTPTTPRTTALKTSSRANLPSYREFGLLHCGQCRLPKEYSHTLWARGIVSGWTCRCDRTPSSPTTPPDLPLAQTAMDAQGGQDAGRLLVAEDPTTGDDTLGRVSPGATTLNNNDEEEATDLTEEDPLEWAYSMTRVPKIEVLVTREVKRTVEEANRQDDTQSGVSVPTKKARESQVVQSGRQEGWPLLMMKAKTLLRMTLEERVDLMKIRKETQKVCGACWKRNPGHTREECSKYEMCWACSHTGALGFISRHHCKPSKVQAVPWGPATKTYEEADLDWYQGRD